MLLALQTAACRNQDTSQGARPAKISATKAYEKYFGPTPTTDKGTCYAFVIYFPSAKEPGKIVPFPFFTFDEKTMKKVAVERLLGGMDEGSYKGEILQPLNPGTHLLDLIEERGTVTVNFSKEILDSPGDKAAERALLNALALSVLQFPGIKDIRVQVDGKEKGTVGGKDVARFLGNGGLTTQPLVPDEDAVAQLPPPRLLSITAVKDKGAKDVEEVNAYFDRPVDIKEIKIAGRNDVPFEGEVYHSVFDMAAVLKPKDATLFKAGMPVKVRWKAVDKLGRSGEGDQEFLLEVKEH
ncbi:GerMN domain-containing protein [Geobacter sp. DSM 9736]|uniref:GerMN domain-containing protein n=1 Tax=Geobacter sp. DSM 9736 TaxID=1277350 RepID=UPI00210133C6|nr:GerMN domain-containing protein [Geobacter sp. DSM 9736]